MPAIDYKGLVVTSIKVDFIDQNDKTKVQFDDKSETGVKARFLKDVKETGEGSKRFTATVIEAEEAKKSLTKWGILIMILLLSFVYMDSMLSLTTCWKKWGKRYLNSKRFIPKMASL